jgi:uncharacterized glyoxalase superfamily metalloenzyme YdcJ
MTSMGSGRPVSTTQLRSRFAARLSSLYGVEVPAYATLVEVAHEVNQRVLARDGTDAERLGSIERVSAERHGAIRVGSPRELAQVSRIFGALGMVPCGFYDLRDAAPAPIPVVSTAFRPVEPDELAANPFRVFTSMLVPEDRRFFDADLTMRVHNFLEARELFPAELLELADLAREQGGLFASDADRYLDLAAASFALSSEPVDRAWYTELAQISGVAADIGGVSSTHINHLTPRVLDIDDLYDSMQARGIEMIDEIQGPPRWNGPDVLLRQTSFRALSEPRLFRDPDGSVSEGALRVRFGEVEARGIALTPAGRDRYDRLVASVGRRMVETSGLRRAEVARQVWSEGLPSTELDLCRSGLGFFTFRVDDTLTPGKETPDQAAALEAGELSALVQAEVLQPEPIVYEDFLPRSAAGIFASNLTDRGTMDANQGGAARDADWLSDVIGTEVNIPEHIYAEQVAASIRVAEDRLGRRIRSSHL